MHKFVYRSQTPKQATSKPTTMSTIAINQSVEAAVLKMMTSNTEEIVAKLAAKYGFDHDEAIELVIPKEIIKKEITPRKPKESKKTKESKDSKKDKPKKAKTGYLLFSDAIRAEVRSELEAQAEDGVKVMAKEVVKGISIKWGELSEEEKAEWKAQADALKSGSEGEDSDDLDMSPGAD